MTKLFIDIGAGADSAAWSGAQGLVADARSLSPSAAGLPESVLLRGSPSTSPEWREVPGVLWLAEQGLNSAARFRDAFPGIRVLPRAVASKGAPQYSLGDPYPGEGFRVYAPNMATFRTYSIDDEGIADWLARAAELGFDTIWLEGAEAREAGRGYDLDLLERARRQFAGNILLGGGASELRHFVSLKNEGGCHAAVVSHALAGSLGVAELLEILDPPAGETDPSEKEGAAA